MDVRMTIERKATADVIRVSGRLAGEAAVSEFLRLCESTVAALVIDLGELRAADRSALDALRTLRARGVTLLGISPYISLLLG